MVYVGIVVLVVMVFIFTWKEFPVLRIRGRVNDEIYLTRWWLLGHKKSRVALMLHKMHRPDDHACHHDHPWAFWTLVLKGGYVEQVTHRKEIYPPYNIRGTVHERVDTRHNKPGMLLYRPATHTHRIHALPRGSCWTLVFRLPRVRSWGFWTNDGWLAWEEFIDQVRDKGIAWCGTNGEDDNVVD